MTARLRALPIALPPVHQETIGSYLNRLADANRLKPLTLAALLGLTRRWRRDADDTDGWTPQTIDRLVILTGRPTKSLIHALPALGDMRHGATPDTPAPARAGCRRCMTRHGIHSLVICRAPSYESVCLRHRCWLGGPDQHRLDRHPDILHANLRHRQLARRTGPDTQPAYQQALIQITDWFHTGPPDLRQRWTQRLDQLGDDPYLDPFHPSRKRIEFVCYPETVTLTGVLCSPHWQHRTDRLDEAQRRFTIRR
jgi:hypothetical protein